MRSPSGMENGARATGKLTLIFIFKLPASCLRKDGFLPFYFITHFPAILSLPFSPCLHFSFLPAFLPSLLSSPAPSPKRRLCKLSPDFFLTHSPRRWRVQEEVLALIKTNYGNSIIWLSHWYRLSQRGSPCRWRFGQRRRWSEGEDGSEEQPRQSGLDPRIHHRLPRKLRRHPGRCRWARRHRHRSRSWRRRRRRWRLGRQEEEAEKPNDLHKFPAGRNGACVSGEPREGGRGLEEVQGESDRQRSAGTKREMGRCSLKCIRKATRGVFKDGAKPARQSSHPDDKASIAAGAVRCTQVEKEKQIRADEGHCSGVVRRVPRGMIGSFGFRF